MKKHNLLTILTERLLLRPLKGDDAEWLTQTIYGDPRVVRFLPFSELEPLERSKRTILRYTRYWVNHGYGPWAILDKHNNHFIGRAGLKPFTETGEVELIYAVSQEYWSRGMATESAKASLRFGFTILGFDKIIAMTEIENTASQHVLRKIGMKYLGLVDTEYYERPHTLYEIKSQDWEVNEEIFEIFSMSSPEICLQRMLKND